MRVKSIVIDGFKSYAHRKELADLSPHFNAITGLNGSGKSNIFDAICFVMGITNLKKVRAEDPRELIFRAGTTGVHAARVTIEFRNDDPATAPPGYSCEDYPIITIGRQIKIGGKQQFFFNNSVSMQSKVKRFFESISLNVDNPHFMVLQGTVHKLIGLRSQVLLSLVEEAVGTKAFDHRRRTAELLIRNKERKMEEINYNIETQIGPMLEVMKADQEDYHRFLKVSEGLDEKKQFRIAFEYHQRCLQLVEKEAALAAKQASTAAAKEQLQGIPTQEDEVTRSLMRLQESISAPSEAAVVLHEEEGELKKGASRYQGQLDSCRKAVAKLQAQLTQLHCESGKQRQKQEVFQDRRAQHAKLLQCIKEERDRVLKIRQALHLLQSGIRAGASGMSLEEEGSLIEVKTVKLDATIKRAKEHVSTLVEQLQTAQKHRNQLVMQNKQLEDEVQRAKNAIQQKEAAYAPLAEKLARAAELEVKLNSMKTEFLRLVESSHANDGGSSGPSGRSFELHFCRRSCPPGTDQKILGRIGELIVPSEDKYCLGLLVGAQSQLLRVVVTEDAVAEAVIKSGLRQRTAFVALNQVAKPRGIEPARLEAAKRIAKSMNGFVYVASELVVCTSDTVPTALVDQVFGNFFVCSSLALAQELAYSSTVKVKSVTLDGEVAEPNGLLTGGSTGLIRNLFAELKAFRQRKGPIILLQQSIQVLEKEYGDIQGILRAQQHTIQSYRAAEDALHVAQKKLDLVHSSAKDTIAEIEEHIRAERAALEDHEKEYAALLTRRGEIAKEIAVDPTYAREDLQKQLQDAETKAAIYAKQEEAESAAFEHMDADMEQQAADLSRKTVEAEAELAQQQHELVSVEQKAEEINEKMRLVQEKCKKAEAHRRRIEKEIDEAQEVLSRCAERKAYLDTTVKNAEAEARELHKTVEEWRRLAREDERRHDWLKDASAHFGPVNGPYYFDDDARTAQTLKELREAEAQAAVMSKRMNKKATILYEDRKREYDELVQQRVALGEDREAIQRCIQGIEDKKWQALDRMVGIVSNIFGKLFSTCLPGATAELVEERDDSQHLCGLTARVLFSGKAKESLSELSGGQRSLLALCLILAILRVRPAPIYILDEVDAALDPSHTQNIGRMLQIYFPQSQFLLVSLKDGMFSNANVLYHIRNTQGYSEISRVENRSNAAAEAHEGVTVRDA